MKLKFYYKIPWFTIPELIVIISIISILSTMGFVGYNRYTQDARETVRKTHVSDIKKVMQLYKQKHLKYPEPTNGVNITYSWSIVWTQGTFGKTTMAQIGKIFWNMRDPKHDNEYTYSLTQNKREYQLGVVFEKHDRLNELISQAPPFPSVLSETYASSAFDPSVYDPIIWLSSEDVNGDGNTTNNPSTGTVVSNWVNKGILWASWNPTLTWNVEFESAALNGFNSIVVDQNAGILLNNSDITRGEIYYVLHKTNKAVGSWLRWVQEGFHIWPWHNCVDSININKSPEFYTNLSWWKKDPYFYSFYTDNVNYTFRTNGNNLWFSGPTNSITWVTWAFNTAWHDVESKSKKKWQNCSSAASSSTDIAIWEVLIFDSDVYALTEEDRLKIEWYLAWKWGLESKLPTDHPFKSNPPEWPTDEWIVQDVVVDSWVYVEWDYNGIIAHTSSWSTHFVLAAPSIITTDILDTDLQSIISNRKFAYSWYHSIPSSYSGSIQVKDSVFPYYSEYPLLFQWTKEELGSYNGLKNVNDQIRYKYRSSVIYPNIENYLSDHKLWYLENILGNHIWINPIKPFFCSEILESRFIFNIAKEAGLSGNSSSTLWYWLPALTNGVIDNAGDLDYEYHSETGTWYIQLDWDNDKTIWFIRIFNRVNQDSDKLTGAILSLYDENDVVLYEHTLWDTSNDYLIDFDLVALWEVYNNVRYLRLETTDTNPLHVREIEVYVWGDIQDGYYTVDSDGIWGKEPYQVYCDMTTDGLWWTKVSENFISYGNFETMRDPDNFTGYFSSGSINNISDNTIRSDITPPNQISNANVLEHRGISTSSYNLEFDNIPNVEFTSEIRLWAWVRGSNKTPFSYTINYEGESPVIVSSTINGDVADPDAWRYEEIRIPLTNTLEKFTWELGRWINATSDPYYITGLSLELFYN